jgi:hypothetical protein
MRQCFHHKDTDFRLYTGLQYEDAECTALLQGAVRASMLDLEEQIRFLEDLTDLAGLPATGFQSDRILADIQSIQNEDPQDLRTWRIGEAFAEVALESNFNVRFHWNELRNKTGADILGFIEINGDVLFLFGETKTSSEIANRPPQVMTGALGIEVQLRELYTNAGKRMTLIRYLASKTSNLEADHPFKIDYQKAMRSYYKGNHPQYQIVGVLIRDVTPDENDIRPSYGRLSSHVQGLTGIKLLACYIPISKSNWQTIIEGVTGEQ